MMVGMPSETCDPWCLILGVIVAVAMIALVAHGMKGK
jgi:hypothetical protein